MEAADPAPLPAPLQALCPPLAPAVRMTLATATAGLHHCACLPGGCSFKTLLSACLSGIRFVSCPPILGIVLLGCFCSFNCSSGWPHWDVGATSANINPVVVQAWTAFVWRLGPRLQGMEVQRTRELWGWVMREARQAQHPLTCLRSCSREGSSIGNWHHGGDGQLPLP